MEWVSNSEYASQYVYFLQMIWVAGLNRMAGAILDFDITQFSRGTLTPRYNHTPKWKAILYLFLELSSVSNSPLLLRNGGTRKVILLYHSSGVMQEHASYYKADTFQLGDQDFEPQRCHFSKLKQNAETSTALKLPLSVYSFVSRFGWKCLLNSKIQSNVLLTTRQSSVFE